MRNPMNLFEELAVRLKRGDPQAGVQLRSQLQGALVRMVRGTLRSGNTGTALGRRILAESLAETAQGRTDPAEDREQLIRRVAQRICDAVLQEIRLGSPAGAGNDTLVSSGASDGWRDSLDRFEGCREW
jgi:hypothetical protein